MGASALGNRLLLLDWLSACGSAVLLKTGAAQDRSALRRAKRYGRIYATGGADRPRLGPNAAPASLRALGLAGFAAFGVVVELPFMEEELLSSGKDKFVSTIGALQCSIAKFHCPRPTVAAGQSRRFVLV